MHQQNLNLIKLRKMTILSSSITKLFENIYYFLNIKKFTFCPKDRKFKQTSINKFIDVCLNII